MTRVLCSACYEDIPPGLLIRLERAFDFQNIHFTQHYIFTNQVEAKSVSKQELKKRDFLPTWTKLNDQI